MASARKKEVAIRKALGAAARQILTLLNRDFAKLIILSNLIAGPLAYYYMEEWLSEFAYRISIDSSVFILSAGSSLALALVLVSVQTLRASLADPVEGLRDE